MVLPYNNDKSKKNEVRAMFDNIAFRYDFLNHFLSFGIDVYWRKRLIALLMKSKPEKVLDMATGTGDLAIMAAKAGVSEVTGIDLSPNMIKVGVKKVERKHLVSNVNLQVGDAEGINFDHNYFDASMVAFGVRNFDDLEKGLLEMNRVIKPGSPVFILEFSKPTRFPVKQFYHFYSFKLLPFFGKLISKDKRAYTYLPESIKEFPAGKDFLAILEKCNYSNCSAKTLSFGIATIYSGYKKRD